MAPQEKVTYFGYNEGIDPSLLRLGTMALDYSNPRQRSPYRHREAPELFEQPPRATADHRPYCTMGQRKTFAPEASIGLDPLLVLESKWSKLMERWVVGRNGSKIELVDPEDFFKSLLEEDAARTWLRVILTVAHRYQKWWQNMFNAPKIWLLTGIYLIEDAMVLRTVSTSSSNGLSANIPVPDPAGIAAILGLQVHGGIKLANGTDAVAETQILGRKVWAAQWQLVGCAYFTERKVGWDPKGNGTTLKLLSSWSLDTERGEEDEIQLAGVGLSSDAFAGQEGGDVQPSAGDPNEDEKLLSDFDDDVNDLMQDLTG